MAVTGFCSQLCLGFINAAFVVGVAALKDAQFFKLGLLVDNLYEVLVGVDLWQDFFLDALEFVLVDVYTKSRS